MVPTASPPPSPTEPNDPVIAGTAVARVCATPTRLRPAIVLVCLVTLVIAASADPAPAARVSLGAYIPGADRAPSRIDAYGRRVGRKPRILISYKHWGQAPFVREQLDRVWLRGAVPMITWEPWSAAGRGINLRAIARGRHDRYLRRSARRLAAWGHPVFVRFAHEMNGSWYPWSRTSPAVYRAAWRHLVRVFERAGARTVRWVWAPYVDAKGHLPFRRFFPGGRWTDWVALDGVNWGGSFPWRTPAQLFRRSYHLLTRLTARPVMIAETGSGEVGGSKPRWVRTLLRRALPRMPRVRAALFWDVADRRGDLRVNSTRSSLRSLRAAVRGTRYRSSRRTLLRIPSLLGSAGHPSGATGARSRSW